MHISQDKYGLLQGLFHQFYHQRTHSLMEYSQGKDSNEEDGQEAEPQIQSA